MKKQFLGWTAAALLFPFFAAGANDKHDAFLKAEKKARYGDYEDMKKVTGELDHPLKPYVEKAYWQRNPSLQHQTEIENYLNVYQNTPLEWPVRKAWLEYLKKQNKKAAYIRNYRETSNNELTCPYLSFQLDLGAPENAIMNQVSDLWVVGKS